MTCLAEADWLQLKTKLDQAKEWNDNTDEAAEKSEATVDDKTNDMTVEQMKEFMKNLLNFDSVK